MSREVKAVERQDEGRLAEAPRTREEKLLTKRHVAERQEHRRLVHVCKAVLTQFTERIDVCRRLLHAANYNTSPKRENVAHLPC